MPTVNRAKGKTHKVQNILLQRDREVAEMYRVESTPSAVLVSDGRIASPLAVGPDAIRALVKDATMPPPLKKGDRVPSARASGSQRRNDGSRRARAAVARCCCSGIRRAGSAQTMLDDVKAWESNRPKDAPQLVVISAGSPKANREQGFQSRVLLDSRFAAGRAIWRRRHAVRGDRRRGRASRIRRRRRCRCGDGPRHNAPAPAPGFAALNPGYAPEEAGSRERATRGIRLVAEAAGAIIKNNRKPKSPNDH